MSSDEALGESPELPLAARDAIVQLLVHDLSAAHRVAAVECALLLMDARDAAGCDDVIDLAQHALRTAGVLPAAAAASAGARGRAPAPPAWAATVRSRLVAYRSVLAAVRRGTAVEVRLAQSRRMFGLELFFEVHEVLEPAWRDASGQERTFLQGVIQAAVAWHHATRRNHGAAVRLAGAAHVKLADAPAVWHGFPLGELRDALHLFVVASACGARVDPPHLHWADGEGGG